MFSVREIGYDEIDSLLAMWIERGQWLKANHQEMWNLDELNKESILNKYCNPHCFIAYDDSNRVGGFLLLEKDERYWPEKLEDRAFYFHKFVISINSAGKGYPNMVLNWVKQFAKEKGKDFIRLDYELERIPLRKMYLSNGFKDIEEIKAYGNKRVIKAEYVLEK